MRLLFGALAEWEFDQVAGRLTRAGVDVPLRRKAFQLLAFLLAHRDRMVPKDELLAGVWPGVTVSDATLASTLHELREVLGAGVSGAWSPIRTAHGRGYRFSEPVECLPVLPAPAPNRLAGPRSAREALFAEVDDWLQDAEAGHCRAIVVCGEAGIGKTAFLAAVAERARQWGFAVHRATGAPVDRAPRWWPLQELLGTGFRELPADQRLVWREKFRCAAGVESSHAEAEAALAHTLCADIAELICAAGQEQPLLLEIDALEEVGGEVLTLLEHLMPAIAGARALLVGALNPAAAKGNAALEHFLVRVDSAGIGRVLGGLDVAELAQAVEAARGPALTPDLAEALRRRTNGNPLLLSEIARASASGEDPLHVMTSVLRRFIEREIGSWPAQGHRVLEAAAHLSTASFSARTVAASLPEVSAAAIERNLREGVRRGLLVRDELDPESLRFSRGLTREVLAESFVRVPRSPAPQRLASAEPLPPARGRASGDSTH